MQDIDKEISANYGFEVKSIVPYKDTYILNTSKGKKILKKSPLTSERILFIHGAKEHLYKNNFRNIDRYVCTLDGEPYIRVDGGTYTINEAVDGRECNFDNKQDIIHASRLLASFHKATKGYVAPDSCVARDELGKLPVYFSKRLDEVKKLKKVAKKGKSKFDYLFLEYVDYFYSLGENALELISGAEYAKVVDASRNMGIFCHHDFTHHNIICNENRISLINFDYCCFELKVYDIANFLRRKMRKCNWDINEAQVIMNEYRSVEDISEDEFFVLRLILQFPQKFWRVINKYYNSKRSWSEKSYIAKLQEVIDEVKYHDRFMSKYEQLK
ncbi:MAG: CotS family spore coat protein [Clostridia bacterium]|nr:CotS family spore coat protein [Clostridia bacterium]